MARGKGKNRAGGTRSGAARCAAGADDGARESLYDTVTASIVAQLEDGIFPWVRPWSTALAAPGLPRNAVTGRAYSGINVLILWGAVIEGGYPSQDWLTFRQALAAGGAVRKGERGRTVFYADRFVPKGEREGSERAESSERGEAPRGIPSAPRPSCAR